MLDQVRRWKNLGIRTAAILGHSGHDMDRETENGNSNSNKRFYTLWVIQRIIPGVPEIKWNEDFSVCLP